MPRKLPQSGKLDLLDHFLAGLRGVRRLEDLAVVLDGLEVRVDAHGAKR
jgi:hypothetical protein